MLKRIIAVISSLASLLFLTIGIPIIINECYKAGGYITLWQAEDEGLVPDTVPNHHLPLPTYYTLPNATVSILGHPGGLCLCLPLL